MQLMSRQNCASETSCNHVTGICLSLFMSMQNAGERGSSFRSKFLCGGGRKKRPSLPDFPKEPEPNKTLDVTNIV